MAEETFFNIISLIKIATNKKIWPNITGVGFGLEPRNNSTQTKKTENDGMENHELKVMLEIPSLECVENTETNINRIIAEVAELKWKCEDLRFSSKLPYFFFFFYFLSKNRE